MLDDQIEEGVDGMKAAPVQPHLSERLTDHRLVRATDDLGVEEVAMPDPDSKPAVVFLAEASPVILIVEQGVAFDLIAQVQRRCAGTELLEHHQVYTVGVDLERNRQVLPAEVGA